MSQVEREREASDLDPSDGPYLDAERPLYELLYMSFPGLTLLDQCPNSPNFNALGQKDAKANDRGPDHLRVNLGVLVILNPNPSPWNEHDLLGTDITDLASTARCYL